MSESSISYVHVPELHRYEIRDDVAGSEPVLVGFTEYRLPDDVHVDFVHTEVDDSYGGRGLAGKLVAFALADVRERGLRIQAHCPYVVEWLTRHTEFADLVDPVDPA